MADFQLVLSDTARVIPFLMISSTDHVAAVTGITPTVTLSKNGGAFAAATGTVAEVGNGNYRLTPSAADVGTLGSLILHATGTGADPTDVSCQVIAVNIYDAVRFGVTALPNVNAGANGGLPLGDASGRTTVGAMAADVITAAAIAPDAIGGSELAASAVTEIATGVRTELATELARVDVAVSSRNAVAPDNATIVAIAGYVDTEVAAIKARTDLIPAAPAAVADIPTANANADALLDRANGILTGLTPRQALRVLFDVLASRISGAATTTITIPKAGATIGATGGNRLSATVDADGNRSAVTVDPT